MKVLIADKFEAEGIEQLKAIAGDLAVDPSLKDDALRQKLAEFQPHVLVVRSTKVPAEVQQASDKLKLIIRAGSGFDTIDIKAASDLGIKVANCPGMNAIAVAELTMGLILALDRRIADNVIDLRAGRWNKKEYSKAAGLKGQTIGIIGAGRIGTEVARRALAFEMDVLFTHLGRNRALADYPNCTRTDFDDLIRRSDVVTVHIPGGSDTNALIDEEMLRQMKPTACLINTSRASVVDEAALAQALKEGWIRAAAVDLYTSEPPADAKEITTPLAELPNLYGTHHIGASTQQAQLAVAAETVRILREYKNTGQVLNCVNITRTDAACLLVLRLKNVPGALAHVFANLAGDEINVQEMDHVVHHGGTAASAHIRLSHLPGDETLARIRADKDFILGLDVLPAE